jgi:glycosyltransferase involved in cell wall biosynthesis
MPEQARVSVIIPCYRCSETIERAVVSVAEQTLQPVEVILVDDCSGDDTLTTLYQIQANYLQDWIKVIALPKNAGAGTARNVGWEVATQPYIAFLDSDDSWHAQKIEIQYGWMMKNPNVALTGHACQQVDDEGAVNGKEDFSIVDSRFIAFTKKKLLLSNRFFTPSVMLRRDIVQRYPNGKRYSEDYQLLLEICCAGLQCYRSELPLAYLYKAAYGEAGLSAALWQMEKWELDTYLSLFKTKSIQLGTLLFLVGWSLAKFLRRIAIVIVKKCISNR